MWPAAVRTASTAIGSSVYVAANEALVEEHGRLGGFPVDAVLRVRATIDPVTAEAS